MVNPAGKLCSSKVCKPCYIQERYRKVSKDLGGLRGKKEQEDKTKNRRNKGKMEEEA